MRRQMKRALKLWLNTLDGSESFGRTKAPIDGSARRQLAFDIWWLGFALWLICIIEAS